MQQKLSKFIAVVLVVIILSANSWQVVGYAAETVLDENKLTLNTTIKDESLNLEAEANNNVNNQQSNSNTSNIEAKSNLDVTSNSDEAITTKPTTEEKQEENVANIKIENATNKNIYKGYMYNNKVTSDENKRETEITNKYILNIVHSTLIDSFTISQNDDKFITNNEEEYKADSYNKELKISKKEFNNVFGEKGKIEIKSKEGTILNTINKYTKSDNDEIKVNLSSFKIENIVIETSKPQTEGNVNIEITKAIEKDSDYTLDEIKEFSSLKSSINAVAKNSGKDLLNETAELETQLEEPTQKVSITVNNNRWSTVTTNENVMLNVTLENDSSDDVMYINPKFKIIFPKEVEYIEVGTVQLLFDKEFTVGDVNTYDNEDGTKTIEAQLEGKQTVYNNPTAKGATVTFVADITLNKYTPTTDAKINVVVENGDENKTVSNNVAQVKFVAPSGVVATNSVKGHNENEKLEAINGEPVVGKILAKSTEKELIFDMSIINNYENTLEDVVILGRTMFKGNKNVDTLQNLGTTMDIPMSSKITTSGVPEENVKIYYSTNENATKNLTDLNNNWNTEIVDYSSVKSYMIVLEKYVMQSGKTISFSYKAKAPANLDYENAAYEMYGVYFQNNQKEDTINDKEIAPSIGLSTGKEAVLSSSLESTIGEGESVKAGENLKYIITINNNGSVDGKNATINVEIPNNLEYIPEDGENYKIKTIMPLYKFDKIEEPDWDSVNWEKSPVSKEEAIEMWKEQSESMNKQIEEYEKWVEEQKAQGVEFDENITEQKRILIISVGDVKVLETLNKKLTFKTKHISDNAEDENVKLMATVQYNEDMQAITNEVNNIIKVDYFNVSIDSANQGKIKVGDTYQCIITVGTNDYENSVNNTILKITLPNELKYNSITYEDGKIPNKVNIKGNTLEVNIGTVSASEAKQLTLKLDVKDLPEGIYKKEISINGTIEADGKNVETIPELKDTINKIGVSIVQTCNIPENSTISADEKFTYTFTVTNLSEIELEEITFIDKLPDEVQLKSAETIYPDGTKNSDITVNENGEIQLVIYLSESSSAIINIEVAAKSLTKDTKITNKGKIVHTDINEIESNSITHIIELFDKDNLNPDIPQYTRKITGTIWVDKNKDGIRDANEEKMPNVKVLLLDQNGNVTKNAKNEDCITLTDNDGTYLFNNLNSGTYTVVFLYDSSKYSATIYRKEGVDETLNSDGVDRNVVYEGVQSIAGITEEIKLNSSNIYNIDFGLIESTKFDLKLDKKIKMITVNNGKEVTEHVYDSNLAKIDFEAKYINKSSMVIEYSLTVTNEGGVEGYAKKIADYIPSELKFNSELNKDWYEGSNGTVYNSSLANTVIKPGESKTVTLILTKNMNSEDFGVFSNNAEIYEASNNYGLLDIDSTPGNKASEEDDYSTANVVVGVKTGQAVIYIVLATTILAIIGTGIYVTKNKVLR